jgi:hypothetical protein
MGSLSFRVLLKVLGRVKYNRGSVKLAGVIDHGEQYSKIGSFLQRPANLPFLPEVVQRSPEVPPLGILRSLRAGYLPKLAEVQQPRATFLLQSEPWCAPPMVVLESRANQGD